MSDEEPVRMNERQKVQAAFGAAERMLQAGVGDEEKRALNYLQSLMLMNSEILLGLARGVVNPNLDSRIGTVNGLSGRAAGVTSIEWVDQANNDVGVDSNNRAATRKSSDGWVIYMSHELKDEKAGEMESEAVHEWLGGCLQEKYPQRMPWITLRAGREKSLGDQMSLTKFVDVVFEAMKQGVQKGIY